MIEFSGGVSDVVLVKKHSHKLYLVSVRNKVTYKFGRDHSQTQTVSRMTRKSYTPLSFLIRRFILYLMVINLLKGYITAYRDFLGRHGSSHLVREI